ncbi:MAG: ABC transporter ATP-binding protein [Bulleidia sp.]|nr:ABC transporter ATP-binding protein [Bulleidia sp.]
MMWKYLKKYWIFAVLASAFMVGEVLCDLYQPGMMARIIDNGILGLSNNGIPDLDLVKSEGGRMLLVVVLGGSCGVLSGVFTNLCAQNYGNDIRKDCFDRIMHFSFQQTDAFTTGSLITRTTSDVTQVQNMLAQQIRGFVRCMMFLFGGSFALISLSLKFNTVLLIAVPLILIGIIWIIHKTNPLFTALQGKLDNVNNIIQENVNGARVVKAFVQEDKETKRFEKGNQELVDTQLKALYMMAWLRPLINIILNLATIAIIKVGGIEVQAGSMEPGTIVAAVTYLTQILNAMNMLAMLFQTMSRGHASQKRLLEVLNTMPVIEDGKGEGEVMEHGSVEFDHVSFSYPGRKEPVLEDVNLSIKPGETLAVIGATGSGKSTLVNLIPRFYDAVQGTVKVDGVNVKDWKLQDLRDAVSVVLQKSELFSTTIKDNIAIGSRKASEEEIHRAAQAAQAEDFILAQPDGYDTEVAEQGMSLSGGQRQRIAIARGIVHGGEILILDDSTSALDLKTEAALHKAMDESYSSITRIIIAQRVATAMRADRIAVIDNGRIAAVGNHDELMQSCSVYQDIYASQLGGAQA